MLIQLDGSYHRWLADHSPPFTLLLAVDDATGSVIDDADVVSMTVTASPRRSTFLQQARWDAALFPAIGCGMTWDGRRNMTWQRA